VGNEDSKELNPRKNLEKEFLDCEAKVWKCFLNASHVKYAHD
jgi:hypothetical protein